MMMRARVCCLLFLTHSVVSEILLSHITVGIIFPYNISFCHLTFTFDLDLYSSCNPIQRIQYAGNCQYVYLNHYCILITS